VDVRNIGDGAAGELLVRLQRNAHERYRPRPLNSRGILFRAAESSSAGFYDSDASLGWRNLFEKGLTIAEIPGDHYSMWKEPHLSDLSRAWKSSLDNLRGKAEAALSLSPTLLAALLCAA
jgi:thioesterase domain-containing protein